MGLSYILCVPIDLLRFNATKKLSIFIDGKSIYIQCHAHKALFYENLVSNSIC